MGRSSNFLLGILWSLIGLVIVFIITNPSSLNQGITDDDKQSLFSTTDHKCEDYMNSIDSSLVSKELEGHENTANFLNRNRYKLHLLPTIVIISSSPFSSFESVMISLRSVVLNSDVYLLKRIILLDGTGGLFEGRSKSKLHHEEMEQLKQLLTSYKIQLEIHGKETSSDIRHDELAFRASIEPLLYQLADKKPHAFVFLDSGCIVEPQWLKPLVTAVSLDPYVTAVPNIKSNMDSLYKKYDGNEMIGSKHNGKQEDVSLSIATAIEMNYDKISTVNGGDFDWELNFHESAFGNQNSRSNININIQNHKFDRKMNEKKHQFYYNPKTKLGAFNLLAFAVHSDWWKALGGFESSVEFGLNTGIWTSNVPLQPTFEDLILIRNSKFDQSSSLRGDTTSAASSTTFGSKSDKVSSELGKVPARVPGSGASSLELSLRMWCCGGSIQLIHCSSIEHVTTTYQVIHSKSLSTNQLKTAGNNANINKDDNDDDDDTLSQVEKVRSKLTEREISLHEIKEAAYYQALYTSELWLGKYASKVRAALGAPPSSNPSHSGEKVSSGSVPTTSKVDITKLDAKVMARIASARVELGVNKQCHNIEWYLRDVNPNLFYPFVGLTSSSTFSSDSINSGSGVRNGKDGLDTNFIADHSLVAEKESETHVKKEEDTKMMIHSPLFQLIEEEWEDLENRMLLANVPRVEDHVDVHLLHNLAKDNTRKEFPPKLDKSQYCGLKDADANLLEHIHVASEEEITQAENDAIDAGLVNRRGRLMCIIYCTRNRHGDAVKVVRETWGSKCDGFIAMSDLTEPELPTLNVPHEGPEEYDNIWQKVRSIWLMVYQRYYNEFDWFIIGGDDLYVIVENLRLYLHSSQILNAASTLQLDGKTRLAEPLFLGRRFKANGDPLRVFNSGGAGYMMNQAALKVLAHNALDNGQCQPHLKGFWEDVQVASCLRKVGNTNAKSITSLASERQVVLNKLIESGGLKYNEYSLKSIAPLDTRDSFGKERFHPFTPGNHLTYKINKKNPDWYAKYTIDLKEGLDCCSKDSVSFHYVKPPLMPKIHALLYDCRE